jgi:hypothetical protein
MRIYFAGLALLLTVPVVADDHVDIVKRAFSNISNDFHQEWAFTESVTEEGVTIVGRYDPRFSDNARWNLLTIDGRAPTADEIADYQDDKENEFDGHDDDSEIDIVNLDTLELIEETDDSWVYRFIPEVDDDDDEEGREFMQQVDGTIKVIRDGNYLEYIDLRNNKPIRPAFSVKISRFLTRLTFGPAGDDGPIVPLSIDVEVKGRAILVIKIDVVESIRYSEYEYVGA